MTARLPIVAVEPADLVAVLAELRALRRDVALLTRLTAARTGVDPERAAALLPAIYAFARSSPWTAAELMDDARRAGRRDLLTALDAVVGERGDGAKRFGRWLEKHAGLETDCLRLARVKREAGRGFMPWSWWSDTFNTLCAAPCAARPLRLMRQSSRLGATVHGIFSERELARWNWGDAILGAAAGKVTGFVAEADRELRTRWFSGDRDGLNRQVGRPTSFLVPNEIWRRDLATAPGSAGGYLVDTENVGFIDMLVPMLWILKLGARRLTGLVGNVTVPKETGAATAYWLPNEATQVTEANQTFQQMALSPKTVGCYTELSASWLCKARRRRTKSLRSTWHNGSPPQSTRRGSTAAAPAVSLAVSCN